MLGSGAEHTMKSGVVLKYRDEKCPPVAISYEFRHTIKNDYNLALCHPWWLFSSKFKLTTGWLNMYMKYMIRVPWSLIWNEVIHFGTSQGWSGQIYSLSIAYYIPSWRFTKESVKDLRCPGVQKYLFGPLPAWKRLIILLTPMSPPNVGRSRCMGLEEGELDVLRHFCMHYDKGICVSEFVNLGLASVLGPKHSSSIHIILGTYFYMWKH